MPATHKLASRATMTVAAVQSFFALAACADGPSDEIASVVRSVIPGASVLESRDIDQKSCGHVPDYPGYVRADLDGDGRLDFSVLLITDRKGERVQWEGKQLERREFAFAILMANGKGGFETKYLQRFEDFRPIGAYLELQPPGKVTDRDTNEEVLMKTPGVAMVFCEKSASVYYVSGTSVREVSVVD